MKKLTLFERTFVGQQVMIVTNMTQVVEVDTPEGKVPMEAPITLEGYLVAADNIHFYLGITPNQILTAIKKRKVDQISLAMDEFDAFINEENPNGVVN